MHLISSSFKRYIMSCIDLMISGGRCFQKGRISSLTIKEVNAHLPLEQAFGINPNVAADGLLNIASNKLEMYVRVGRYQDTCSGLAEDKGGLL